MQQCRALHSLDHPPPVVQPRPQRLQLPLPAVVQSTGLPQACASAQSRRHEEAVAAGGPPCSSSFAAGLQHRGGPASQQGSAVQGAGGREDDFSDVCSGLDSARPAGMFSKSRPLASCHSQHCSCGALTAAGKAPKTAPAATATAAAAGLYELPAAALAPPLWRHHCLPWPLPLPLAALGRAAG